MFDEISVVLLGAGESRRMGQPKLLLPWGGTTVLGQVVSTFAAGFSTDSKADDFEIVVVTGGERERVDELITRLARRYPVRPAYNPNYALGGMLGSIQAGLQELRPQAKAALIGLGDQPQVRVETVRRICSAFLQAESLLVVPSFQNRRGHPWLASRLIWPEILALPTSTTPRQFLDAHTGQVVYVEADESILQDLDTPEDYNRQRP